MTMHDLKDTIWRRLPLRKILLGREAVDDLVELAVHNWEPEPLTHCTTDAQRQVVARNILMSVRRGYQAISGKESDEYGMFFWPILLQAIASLVVQLILQWWLESRMNRIRMVVWKTEMHR
jgi:hypothetical protein